MADETRLDAARAGDPAARRMLAEEIWPIAYRIAYALLSVRPLAEDAAQESVVAVLEGLHRLRQDAALPAYVRTVAARQAYRELRRRQRERPEELAAARALDWLPEDHLDLRRALWELPDRERLVILLHHAAGLTSREVGQALGMPASTVRSLLLRARERLREALKEVWRDA